MDEKPRRRWRFSLRALFVLVTIGAIVSFVVTQRPKYEVVGIISADEARAVYEELLREYPELKDGRILVIESKLPGTAKVTTSLPEGWITGRIKGKLRGVFGMLRYEWATGEVAWRSTGVVVSKWDDHSGEDYIDGELRSLVHTGTNLGPSARAKHEMTSSDQWTRSRLNADRFSLGCELCWRLLSWWRSSWH